MLFTTTALDRKRYEQSTLAKQSKTRCVHILPAVTRIYFDS